ALRQAQGWVVIALFACTIGLLADQSRAAQALRPPVAKRSPVALEHHGISHTDDYAWLRTKKLDEVLRRPEALEAPIHAHLEAEARYARSVLAPNRAVEQRLLAEMRGRISLRDATVPETRGPWQYYTRYAAGAQRKLH